MQIKVDEDLPQAVAVLLREKGYETSTVREQDMGGWDDAPLWDAVQEKEQLLITADKGFRKQVPAEFHRVSQVHGLLSSQVSRVASEVENLAHRRLELGEQEALARKETSQPAVAHSRCP